MLPAFSGERIERLEQVVAEVAAREIREWPRDRPFETHPLTQRLTMEVILRAVFGFEPGERLDRVRAALTSMNTFATSPVSLLPPAQRSFGGRGPWARFVEAREQADRLIYEEMAIRRAAFDAAGAGAEAAGDDMLGAFLLATHEDGTPMSDVEIRDELMTLLVAGHETTATSLAWGLERLSRHPDVLARLVAEVDAGEGDEYMTAVIREILRCRPTLPTAQPRLVKEPVEIGGWTYPVGVNLMAAAWLVHRDPEIYPEPQRLQARALPRGRARHLHLDPVRRRPPPLRRGELRDPRDEGRAARDPPRGLAAGRDGAVRADPPPLDHDQPRRRRRRHPSLAGPEPRYGSGSRSLSRFLGLCSRCKIAPGGCATFSVLSGY